VWRDSEFKEWVLIDTQKARKLFGKEHLRDRSVWSEPKLTWNKDAYFSYIKIETLVDAGCVCRCHVYDRPDDEKLFAELGIPLSPRNLRSVYSRRGSVGLSGISI
jgi:hypothetical protein